MNTIVKTQTETATALTPHLLHLLHRAGQSGDELFTKSFRDHKLTPRQFAVLTAAQKRDEPSQAALVADTGIDRSTLADIVGRLVEKGLVERHRTKRDARAYAIKVTDKGHETIAALSPRLAQIEMDALSVLSQDEQAHFVEQLGRIVEHLSEMR